MDLQQNGAPNEGCRGGECKTHWDASVEISAVLDGENNNSLPDSNTPDASTERKPTTVGHGPTRVGREPCVQSTALTWKKAANLLLNQRLSDMQRLRPRLQVMELVAQVEHTRTQ